MARFKTILHIYSLALTSAVNLFANNPQEHTIAPKDDQTTNILKMLSREQQKKQAAEAAASLVEPGMVVGLGTGSTIFYLVQALGERVAAENLEITAVSTSDATSELAKKLNIPLVDLASVKKIDLTIDGADEFSPSFCLIKGGGGALTREKEVAKKSNFVLIVTDQSKQVEVLGAFPLPIEVDPAFVDHAMTQLQTLCPGPVQLRQERSSPFITDRKGYIIDCHFGPTITDPAALASTLESIEGVRTVGLFIDLCNAVFIGMESGEVVKLGTVAK